MQNALITQAELAGDRLEEGDAALVLKKDGSFRVLNCHDHIDPKALTERQMEQGKTLAAFALLLRHPEIMAFVTELATDITAGAKPMSLGRMN